MIFLLTLAGCSGSSPPPLSDKITPIPADCTKVPPLPVVLIPLYRSACSGTLVVVGQEKSRWGYPLSSWSCWLCIPPQGWFCSLKLDGSIGPWFYLQEIRSRLAMDLLVDYGREGGLWRRFWFTHQGQYQSSTLIHQDRFLALYLPYSKGPMRRYVYGIRLATQETQSSHARHELVKYDLITHQERTFTLPSAPIKVHVTHDLRGFEDECIVHIELEGNKRLQLRGSDLAPST